MNKKINKQPFFLDMYSPWPLIMSMNLLILFVSLIYWFKFKLMNYFFFQMLMMMLFLIYWFRDIIRENQYKGIQSIYVHLNLKFAFLMLILSEILFFISFFWSYFHYFLVPDISIGNNWPPKNILIFDPYKMPLLNTLILLSSGVTISISHYNLINNKKFMMNIYLLLTILLGIIFLICQYIEYNESIFSMYDSVFGSIFYIATGFHGTHVFIGILFLLFNLIRMLNNEFSKITHIGYEMAIWYWHFVDLVWIALYIFIYHFPN